MIPRDQLIQDVTVVDYVAAKTDLVVIGVKNAVISMMDLLVIDVSQITMGSQIAHVRFLPCKPLSRASKIPIFFQLRNR